MPSLASLICSEGCIFTSHVQKLRNIYRYP